MRENTWVRVVLVSEWVGGCLGKLVGEGESITRHPEVPIVITCRLGLTLGGSPVSLLAANLSLLLWAVQLMGGHVRTDR